MPIANQTSTSLSILPFTSSEPGAWSNSYLISGKSEAVLFDVFMLRSDAAQIADGIAKTGKTLSTVMISHAHPDHFMGLEVITHRFPQARVVSTANVVADIRADGPRWRSRMRCEMLISDRIFKCVWNSDLVSQGICATTRCIAWRQRASSSC